MTNNEIYDEAREKFFNFLLKKPCTSKQAREYLSRNKIPDGYKKILMTEAKDMGLIDDLTFARLFIDGHLHWGNAKIIYELGARGVAREEIYSALDEAPDENERARELYESWQKTGLPHKKIINRLLSRGFSHLGS